MHATETKTQVASPKPVTVHFLCHRDRRSAQSRSSLFVRPPFPSPPPFLPSSPSSARVASHSQIYLVPNSLEVVRRATLRGATDAGRAPTGFSVPLFFAAIDPSCAPYARLTRCISLRRVTGFANCRAVSTTMRVESCASI